MTTANSPLSSLRIWLNFTGSLFEPDTLNRLQALLLRHAPTWSSGMLVWRFRRKDSTPIDLDDASSLYKAVTACAVERGELYYKLEAARGAVPSRDRSGDAEVTARELPRRSAHEGEVGEPNGQTNGHKPRRNQPVAHRSLRRCIHAPMQPIASPTRSAGPMSLGSATNP